MSGVPGTGMHGVSGWLNECCVIISPGMWFGCTTSPGMERKVVNGDGLP